MPNKFAPSTEQQSVYDWIETGTGNAVIEAVAGAGKTTTLVGAVERMRGSIFLGAYNRKMAEELKSRTGHIQGLRSGTFHSAGFGVLRRHLRLSGNPDGKKMQHIAARLVVGTPFEGIERTVASLVSLAKQTGIGVAGMTDDSHLEWSRLVDRHDVMDALPEYVTKYQLIEFAQKSLEISNAETNSIDFDDMIYLPLLMKLRFYQNDWVLIDEAQDTNATRREMARRMLRSGGRLIAVGDPRQAIFGFTGADSESLELIRRDFDATTLRLSVSFRCPKAVVRAAQQYVSHIEPAATAPEGRHDEMTETEMLKFVRPGDAILSRVNRPLVALCFRLLRDGVSAKIEGRSIGEGLAALAGRWKVKSLDELDAQLYPWFLRETEKAELRENDARVEFVEDQYETMRVLIDRAQSQGVTTISGLQEMIRSMFDDVGSASNTVVLSSVHRSKGLEWDRVFVYDRASTMPSRRAVQEWQIGQEMNLIYVALTRAKNTLVDVTPTKEDK